MSTSHACNLSEKKSGFGGDLVLGRCKKYYIKWIIMQSLSDAPFIKHLSQRKQALQVCLPLHFLPSSAVTMQFSQAPQTTNPSTSACTEKQQPTASILKDKERITPDQTVA